VDLYRPEMTACRVLALSGSQKSSSDAPIHAAASTAVLCSWVVAFRAPLVNIEGAGCLGPYSSPGS
jgi:hypothetical protein